MANPDPQHQASERADQLAQAMLKGLPDMVHVNPQVVIELLAQLTYVFVTMVEPPKDVRDAYRFLVIQKQEAAIDEAYQRIDEKAEEPTP